MLVVEGQNRNKIKIVAISIALLVLITISALLVQRAFAARDIVFPVIGPASFSNDFNSPRSNGAHRATDIMASKGRQIVSATDGTITYVGYPQPSWGYMISIKDSEGYTYNYLHINNDNPGTDDGQGGAMNAYAADIQKGNPVKKGQLLGWVGDSGNAETTAPHLHFEIVEPNGNIANPYDSLVLAPRIGEPATHPALPGEVLPYGPHVGSMVNVALGNFDNDPAIEMVSGAGKGGGPHVRLFDANDTFMGKEFFAYGAGFRGGVDVAAGDVDGDGIDEIITSPGPGGGPHVRILKTDGTEVGSFFAYDPRLGMGVRVAAGDVDGDGIDEIITSPGPGAGPHVRIMKMNGQEVRAFYAYSPQFTGGVDVAAGDVTGTNAAEIVTGAGPGAGPHVRIFNSATGASIGNGFAAYSNFGGGVKVSVGNVRTNTAKSEIVTTPDTNGGPYVRMFSADGAVVSERMYMEPWWNGNYDVAAETGKTKVSTGINRRASIRPGVN